jgi:SAM-dependent methyltransferase
VDNSRSIEWLHVIRDYELNEMIKYFPANRDISILELGAGTGYQLSKIREKYADVTGVEIESSSYSILYGNVITYNGKVLPFEDKSFDVVFSSHVMEHISEIVDYNKEISRVLKDNGRVIHVLPSHVWRFWTSLMHYPNSIVFLANIIRSTINKKYMGRIEKGKITKSKILANILFSETHGEMGNSLTELYYFHHHHWLKLFKKSNWKIVEYRPLGLFYWGRDFIMDSLSVNIRESIARIIGSSSYIYVLKKTN